MSNSSLRKVVYPLPNKILKSDRGFTMAYALMIGLITTVLGIALWHVSSTDVLQVQRDEDMTQAYYYAKSGVEVAIGYIINRIPENYRPVNDVFYGNLGDSSFLPTETNDYNIQVAINFDPIKEEYVINSTGVVRRGSTAGAQVASNALGFKISLASLKESNNGGIPEGESGAPFALFSLEDISLISTPSINGNVGTNSTKKGAVVFTPNGTKIKGELYVGYDADNPEAVVSHPNYTKLADHVTQLPVQQLAAHREYPLPIFPAFPEGLPDKGTLVTEAGIISGAVRDGSGKGVGNVQIYLSPALSSGKAKTSVRTTDNPGWIGGHGGWTSYTTGTPSGSEGQQQGAVVVTPYLEGYTFMPQSIEVTGPASDINFVAMPNGEVVSQPIMIDSSQSWYWKISEDGYYDKISVTSNRNLWIDLGGRERILRVKHLDISQGEIRLANTGENGRLIIYVDNTFNIGGSSRVNGNGDAKNLIIYYKGSNNVNFGGSQSFVGSFVVGSDNPLIKAADITLGGSCKFTGTLLSSGNNVTVSGGSADAVRGLIYAPRAHVKIMASAIVTGTVIAKQCSLSGGSNVDLIAVDNNLDTIFFNSLNWGTTGPPNLFTHEVQGEPKEAYWRRKGTWIWQ